MAIAGIECIEIREYPTHIPGRLRVTSAGTAGEVYNFGMSDSGVSQTNILGAAVHAPRYEPITPEQREMILAELEDFNDFSDPAWKFWDNDYDADYDNYFSPR